MSGISRLAFAFSGEGSQWPGMGRGLIGDEPVFRAAVERCDEAIAGWAGWRLLDELCAAEAASRLHRTEFSQPAIYAVEVALVALLRSWGVTPDVVLGHSLGEAAAAHTAGALSLEDGLRVAFEQGRILQQASGHGAMGAIGLPGDSVQQRIGERPGVSIAALNGPASTVVAGDRAAVTSLVEQLRDEGAFARPLHVEYAPHSPHMDPLCPSLREALDGVRPRTATVPIRPALAGRHDGEPFGAGYWTAMVREPILFAGEVDAWIDDGVDGFLEISPAPVLATSLEQCVDAGSRTVPVLATLRRGQEERPALLETLRALEQHGRAVDWDAVDGVAGRSHAAVPAHGLPDRVDDAPAGERHKIICAHVAGRVAEAVGSLDADEVDLDAGLFDLGLDSVGAVKLAKTLGADLEGRVSVPSTLAFDLPSALAITDWLAGQMEEGAAAVASDSRGEPSGRPAASRSGTAEPIAVIGMACRFPGAADPESYWSVLRDGIDATGPMPRDRWDVDALLDDDPDAAGKVYQRRGGFLEGVDQFDAAFFGISPREAASMDPQQRLLLEVAWEALEHAGQAPDRLRYSETGVYAGIGIDDYKDLQTADPEAIDAYTGTGNLFCVAAGRLSYVLGLQGPSMAVDTGCSSSLVTVHLASQALRAGECDVALAGGVHLMLGPDITLFLSRARALSPSGRSKTFDAGADGYCRSEGCGMVVLKRLADARADGDDVLAVLRGSAVNHDGPSSGLTVPNGRSQQKLLRRALASAGVEPAAISYVEAHGTGTPLGDPIELQALDAVLSQDRPSQRPLQVGSAKTNIGHLESAAGVAGLIKVILALQHAELPPHLNLHEPNPKIPWDSLSVEVPTALRPWPRGERRRLAGVSSFGIGGTNAHVVVEEAPNRPAAALADPEERSRILPLSAGSEEALRELAAALAARLDQSDAPPLRDVVHTAATGRAHLRTRLAAVVRGPEQAARELAAVAAGADASSIVTGSASGGRAPRVAFVFTGQGSQHLGMARGLYDRFPRFRAIIEKCERLMAPQMALALRDVMFGTDQALLDQTIHAQPAIFAVEVALADLWSSWGIRPVAVLGHSVGELAAATVAGALALEDAAELVARRGMLMQALPAGGRMVTVLAGADELEDAVAAHRDSVAIAALNGPAETVVSGAADAVAEITGRLAATGVRHRELPVSHAFHSPLVEPVLDPLEAAADAAAPGDPSIRFVSSVTGRQVERGELCQPGYWRRGAREPVAFFPAVRTLLAEDIDAVVEVGPMPALTGIARRARLDDRGDRPWLPSLANDRDDVDQMLQALARLYVEGAAVEWDQVDPDGGRKVALPTYPFQRRRHWRDTRASASRRSAGGGPRRHEGGGSLLLGEPLRSPAIAGTVFQTDIGQEHLPDLAEHVVFGRPVVSAAALVATLIAAAGRSGAAARPGATGRSGPTACELREVSFPAALVAGETRRLVQVILDDPAGAGAARIASVPSDAPAAGWTVHATATVAAPRHQLGGQEISLEAVRSALTLCSQAELHAQLAAAGYLVSGGYQWIETLHTGDHTAVASLTAPAGASPTEDGAPHAGLLDSCLRTALALAPVPEPGSARVPFTIESVRWESGDVVPAFCIVDARPSDAEDLVCDLRVIGESGRQVAAIEGLHLRLVSAPVLLGAQAARGAPRAYATSWEQVDRPSPAQDTGGTWLLLGSEPSLDAELVNRGVDCRAPELEPACEESIAELAACLRAEASRLTHVVLLSAEGERPAPAVAEYASAAVAHLVRALDVAALPVSPEVLLVARGAQAVTDGDGGATLEQPGGAALAGLARVAAAEHPDQRWKLVDLDPAATASDDADTLLAAASSAGPALAARGGRLTSPRLEARVLDEAPPPRLSGEGTYLVTGGRGALGLWAARWLAERGARRLVLAGRRPPEREAEHVIQELRAGDVEVIAALADVARAEDVERLVRDADAAGRPLRGVIHAAGTLDDGVLGQQSTERIRGVIAPKVAGAWHLHELTRDCDIELFILFSSVAAVAGPPGQGAYAAANAALDGIAAARHSAGLPALSVGWGPWAGTGMAAGLNEREQTRLAARGIGVLSPKDAGRALDQLLATRQPALVFATLDGERWPASAVPLTQTPFPESAQTQRLANRDAPHARPAGLGPYVAPRGELERELAEIWEELFAIAPIGVEDDFFALGGDSILSLQLAGRARRLGLQLADGDALARPTIAELVAQLPRTEIEVRPTGGDEPAATEEQPFPDAGLSADDLDRLMIEIGG